MGDADRIDLEIEAGVALITLNAPERRNALTPQLADDLIALCERLDSDMSVGAAVITGADNHFCAGAHRRVLATAGEDPADPQSYADIGKVYGAFQRIGRLAVPTIAAVKGAAVGAGVNLMMATDLRIVGRSARVIAGFLRIGIHPGGGHFVLMDRTAGRETTAAMTLFSEEISGERAAELGMAWECVADEDVVIKSLELAGRAARDPELARAAVATFRAETGPPGVSWEVASQAERATQMWSLRRRTIREQQQG